MAETKQPLTLSDLDGPSTEIKGGDGTNDNNIAQPDADENKNDDPAGQAAGEGGEGNSQGDGTGEDGEGGEGGEGGEEGELDVEDAVAFYAEVDKLSGLETKIEYPEGIHPMSPEGVYHRDKVLAEQHKKDYDAWLQQTNPRGYRYMLHTMAGGTDEEWFGAAQPSLPDYEVFKGNVDLHKRVYVEDLKRKGVDDDIITAAVDKAVKDGTLFTKADKLYQDQVDREKQDLEDLKQENARQAEAFNKAVGALEGSIDELVYKGKDSRFKIADAKQQEFSNFIKDHITHDGENFYLSQALTPESLNKIVEALYFQFIGGDIKQMVAREAQTQNAARIGRFVSQSGKKPKNTAAAEKPAFTALGDI